jgi:hypothetical protein
MSWDGLLRAAVVVECVIRSDDGRKRVVGSGSVAYLAILLLSLQTPILYRGYRSRVSTATAMSLDRCLYTLPLLVSFPPTPTVEISSDTAKPSMSLGKSLQSRSIRGYEKLYESSEEATKKPPPASTGLTRFSEIPPDHRRSLPCDLGLAAGS